MKVEGGGGENNVVTFSAYFIKDAGEYIELGERELKSFYIFMDFIIWVFLFNVFGKFSYFSKKFTVMSIL